MKWSALEDERILMDSGLKRMTVKMLSSIVSALLVTAVSEVLAATQNTTLVAGSSDNFTFNGGGWQGPGDWRGLDPENESCTESPGRYSSNKGISVSIVFQGVAIYFVGWNNSRNGVYQPYLDGVPDSPVTAYIPAPVSGPWYCNVVQYERTGLANMQHNLTMVLLANDPGDIKTPGMGVSGVIVTEQDDELPLSITSIVPVALPPTPTLNATSNPSSLLPTTTGPDGIIAPTPSDNSLSFDSTPVIEHTAPGSTSKANSLSATATILASSTTTGPPVVTRTPANNDLTSDQSRVIPATLSDGSLVPTTAMDAPQGQSFNRNLGVVDEWRGRPSSLSGELDWMNEGQGRWIVHLESSGTSSVSTPGVSPIVTVASSRVSSSPIIATKNGAGAVRPVDTQRPEFVLSSSETTQAVPLPTATSRNRPISDASTTTPTSFRITVPPPSSSAQSSVSPVSLNHSSVLFRPTDQSRVVPIPASARLQAPKRGRPRRATTTLLSCPRHKANDLYFPHPQTETPFQPHHQTRPRTYLILGNHRLTRRPWRAPWSVEF
ncbi:hypothetical protein C8F04DRAFT_1138609 [Mycena alexandri]|uniref:Uncharacterized protein n=1 Tax=Mycena alexandri TaxID=1745969 RepID=A0AAD6S6W8_9AGAR|nr:hypothetical protein C8F04DRAFT_1138609 [Mycena alexandri]